jgi:hypothetical protein
MKHVNISQLTPLTSGITSVGENCLPVDSLASSTQELHNQSNILHLRQTAFYSHALVECNRVIGFLQVEERYTWKVSKEWRRSFVVLEASH